jgi:hypothetical protein
MEGERRRCQVLHRQARELVYKVFTCFKSEADAGMPFLDVAKAQDVCVCVCVCVCMCVCVCVSAPPFSSVSASMLILSCERTGKESRWFLDYFLGNRYSITIENRVIIVRH